MSNNEMYNDLKKNISMLPFIRKKYRYFFDLIYNHIELINTNQLLKNFEKFIKKNLPEYYLIEDTEFYRVFTKNRKENCQCCTKTVEKLDPKNETNNFCKSENCINLENIVNESIEQFMLELDEKEFDTNSEIWQVIENDTTIFHIYLFGITIDKYNILELYKIKDIENRNIILFFYGITMEIIYDIIKIFEDKKCKVKIYAFEIFINIFFLISNYLYGNDLYQYKMKYMKLEQNKNITVYQNNLNENLQLIDYVMETIEYLTQFKKYTGIFELYDLYDLNINTRNILFKLYYGYVPKFVIENKHLDKFVNIGGNIYKFKGEYYLETKDFYRSYRVSENNLIDL
jgi:hypothetical protein